jgi:hypothetical protein
MTTRTRTAFAAFICTILSACGGGKNEDKDFTTTASEIAAHFSIDPASVTLSRSTVTAPFSTTTRSNCPSTTGSYAVLETANTVVYNADTVSNTDLENATRYAEAAIQTFRTSFGIGGAVGLDGTNKYRVCVTSLKVGGTAGYNDLFVEINTTPDKNAVLASLIKHESMHSVEMQVLGCTREQYGFERWLLEGMALHAGWQDQPKKADLPGLQALFTGGTTPMDDTYARVAAPLNRYPAYRLAYDTMLGELGITDADVYNFLKAYATQHGCPASGNQALNWKADFDAHFPGASLRGSGALGAGFWRAAANYAR